ncbi:putative membrane protein [Bacillus methanolicus MGA3]|uniref:Putative membrane protein n=2 Tax=Bacillus methanolicus TaxID=1471 RepID=A0A068LU14_BACMM|nr:putative membrane protein [Bacillus methanolicus MGA3]
MKFVSKPIFFVKVVFFIYYLMILSIFFLVVSMYKRYYPVKGVPCIEKENGLTDNHITLLDIRDYNEIATGSVPNSMNIPYAYLKRFYQEIPHHKIHVIASDKLELNLGLRFLKRKGFEITSYELTKCRCNNKYKKGVLNYGIR